MTKLRLGRQRIVLDNARHVGDVGWRQNDQTFDAFTVTSEDVENLNSAPRCVEHQHHPGTNVHYDSTFLLNAGYKFEEIGKLTGYAYLLDYDEEANAGTDLATIGARFAGKYGIADDVKALYEAELATQSDYSRQRGHLGHVHAPGCWRQLPELHRKGRL